MIEVMKDCKTSINSLINEPAHDKTNKMACPSSKVSDQPEHPFSLIRVFAVRIKKLSIEHTAKTDQTGRMSRLI